MVARSSTVSEVTLEAAVMRRTRRGFGTVLSSARALGASTLVAGVLLTAVASLLVPSDPVEVIGRRGVQAVLWPLLPTILAACVPASAAWAFRDLERAAPKSRRWLAALHLSLVAVGVVAVVVVVPSQQQGVVLRNSVLLVGLAVISVRLLSPDVAWLPPVLVAAVTWLFGTEVGGSAKSWAYLLSDGDHSPATVLAAVVGVAAAAGWLLWPRS